MIIENGPTLLYVSEEDTIHEEGKILLEQTFEELSNRYSNGRLQISTNKIKKHEDIIKIIKNMLKIAKNTIKQNSKNDKRFLARIDARKNINSKEKLTKELSNLDNYILIEILTRIKTSDKNIENIGKYFLVVNPEDKDYSSILKRNLVPQIAKMNDKTDEQQEVEQK